jgi:hypothetical protein
MSANIITILTELSTANLEHFIVILQQITAYDKVFRQLGQRQVRKSMVDFVCAPCYYVYVHTG